MKNLFIYLDFNFAFNFGHYKNLYDNLFAISRNQDYDFLLVHDYWKHHQPEDDIHFNDDSSIRILATKFSFVEKILRKTKLEDYERVIVYAYKGSIELIEHLLELEQKIVLSGADYRIINTLFEFDRTQIADCLQSFDVAYEKQIRCALSQLDDSRIELAFDLKNSLWNHYVENLVYLPPPLIDRTCFETELRDEKLGESEKDRIVLAFDLWNLNYVPKSRFEELENIQQLIEFVTENYSNVEIRIKILDSNYRLEESKIPSIFKHDRIMILGNLSKEEYIGHLQESDIHILQYSPEYYKNKSSGRLAELILANCFIIGTKNTCLEELVELVGTTYDFGNVESLTKAVGRAIRKVETTEPRNRFYEKSEPVEEYLNSWCPAYFRGEVFDKWSEIQPSGSKFDRIEKPFVVIGNGPSLKGFDFNKLIGFDTIGMNAAYRYWDKIGWYPKYYICLDTVVIKSHHAEIKRLIEKSEEYGIKEFFLRRTILEMEPDLENHDRVLFWEDVKDNPEKIYDCVHVTTGSFAARYAINKGYKYILLLGIDETYVNFIPECEKREGLELEISKTPTSNPNYFFEGYQVEGDKYQIPNHDKVYTCHCRHCNGEIRRGETLHVDAWDFVKMDLSDPEITAVFGDLEILNCNFKSAVKCFEFRDFDNASKHRIEWEIFQQAEILESPNSELEVEPGKDEFLDEEVVGASPWGAEESLPKFLNGNTRFRSRQAALNGCVENRKSFRIDIRLRSFYNSTFFDGIGIYAPPMPAILACFALYDYGKILKIEVNTMGRAQTVVEIENTLDWMDIGLEYDSVGRNVQVFLGASCLAKINVPDIKVFRQEITLGCGFNERYWKGEIAHLAIVEKSNSQKKLFCGEDFEQYFKSEKRSIRKSLLQNIEDPKSNRPKKRDNTDSTDVKTVSANKNNIIRQAIENICYHSSRDTMQDRWVVETLNGKRGGYFLDIGASDGKSANNTLTLEESFGWNGILVEGNSESFRDLEKNRPNQICLNRIISDKNGKVKWRENEEIATRSGIESSLPQDSEEKKWRVGQIVVCEGVTLESVLEEYSAPNNIDFLSMDIEGGEYFALKNFPFQKYKVHLIAVEVAFKNREPIMELMLKNNYKNVKNPYCNVSYEQFFVLQEDSLTDV